jgi:hypothetical protein
VHAWNLRERSHLAQCREWISFGFDDVIDRHEKRRGKKVSKKPVTRPQISEYTRRRLRELEKRGEAIFHPRTNFGPLPTIKLSRKLPPGEFDRIIRAAKGCDDD